VLDELEAALRPGPTPARAARRVVIFDILGTLPNRLIGRLPDSWYLDWQPCRSL
jgi:hypothetical protein